MSRETLHDLNTNTLIGNTSQRGNAWHYRSEEQGEESNHYSGPIPMAASKEPTTAREETEGPRLLIPITFRSWKRRSAMSETPDARPRR